MKKPKKSMIILISILAVIGIAVGGWSMHQYQKKQEMIAIATSDEAKKVYEEYLKKEDPKALTEAGIIKSYEIDKEKLSYNPMGGLMVRLFLNGKKDLRMNFNLIDNGDGTYSTAYYGYTGELNRILEEGKND